MTISSTDSGWRGGVRMNCSHEFVSGRFSIHGLAVELTSYCPLLSGDLAHLFGGMIETDWPEGFAAISGTISVYEESDVLRHLSPAATLVDDPAAAGAMEVYQDGERFWLVDDRWGIGEINVLKSQWRSWVFPEPQIDSFRCTELAVLWPMAQLLRNRGLHLLPTASIATDGWAGLLISRGNIDRELAALAEAGYGIIGQRWTALREEDRKLSLLHLPGRVEHTPAQRRPGAAQRGGIPRWIDLLAEHPEALEHHAFCDAVLMIEPGRRPMSRVAELTNVNAVHAVRRNWPITELHPSRNRSGQFAARLAQACRCYEIQLSRDPADLVQMIGALSGVELTPWHRFGAAAEDHVSYRMALHTHPSHRPIARAS
jgi:hypothetical protein